MYTTGLLIALQCTTISIERPMDIVRGLSWITLDTRKYYFYQIKNPSNPSV